jgi:hypothetical protein
LCGSVALSSAVDDDITFDMNRIHLQLTT